MCEHGFLFPIVFSDIDDSEGSLLVLRALCTLRRCVSIVEASMLLICTVVHSVDVDAVCVYTALPPQSKRTTAVGFEADDFVMKLERSTAPSLSNVRCH